MSTTRTTNWKTIKISPLFYKACESIFSEAWTPAHRKSEASLATPDINNFSFFKLNNFSLFFLIIALLIIFIANIKITSVLRVRIVRQPKAQKKNLLGCQVGERTSSSVTSSPSSSCDRNLLKIERSEKCFETENSPRTWHSLISAPIHWSALETAVDTTSVKWLSYLRSFHVAQIRNNWKKKYN